MISLLRGLMSSDGNTNRPLPSLILLGIVHFCCILIGLEQVSAGKIATGAIWIFAGIGSGLIGYYWSQIKVKIGIGKSLPALPEYRPHVLPTDYAKNGERNAFGLFVRNPGYDALDVHIPDIPIGTSTYMLSFPGILPLLCERDHIVFIEAWLEDQSDALPGMDGSRLHDVMRLAEVEQINFAIRYKGTNFRDYQTTCVIEIVNWKGNGLTVRAVNQE
jgi:hypothetical protein